MQLVICCHYLVGSDFPKSESSFGETKIEILSECSQMLLPTESLQLWLCSRGQNTFIVICILRLDTLKKIFNNYIILYYIIIYYIILYYITYTIARLFVVQCRANSANISWQIKHLSVDCDYSPAYHQKFNLCGELLTIFICQ